MTHIMIQRFVTINDFITENLALKNLAMVLNVDNQTHINGLENVTNLRIQFFFLTKQTQIID